MKRVFIILRDILLSLVCLIAILILLVDYTPVQNYLVRKATQTLSAKLHTTVALRRIRLDLLNKITAEGIYIADRKGDTLLYAGELQTRITDWFVFRKGVPMISYVGLEHAYVHMARPADSDEWNYQFIIDAFDTPGPKKKKASKPARFGLRVVHLLDIRYHIDDARKGSDQHFEVAGLDVELRKFDLEERVLDAAHVRIDQVNIALRDYPGGEPPKHEAGDPWPVDSTPFNPARWKVVLDELDLHRSRFSLQSDTLPPLKGEFDPKHMDVHDIRIIARNLTIEGDTVRGMLRDLGATERCGIVIKKFSADVTVSPVESICEQLYLETNRSQLRDYYAMRYTRFPDFTDYINRVVMEGHLRNSVVDTRDIAFFGPAILNLFRGSVKAAVDFKGTVAKFDTRKLDLIQGKTRIRGNLSMTGLPDIDNTFIDYRQGEIVTSGPEAIRFAPPLGRQKDVNVRALSRFRFLGSFTGFTDRFTTVGTVQTNLGDVVANVRLDLPPGTRKLASYKGTVNTRALNLGTLLYAAPTIGVLTGNMKVEGRGFDAQRANLKFDIDFARFDLNGYPYSNISGNGTLANKQFVGKMQVDDPNLALSFDGTAYLSNKEAAIDARAYLLKSDLHALGLTKDSVELNADFDLKCTASNIDDFDGYAKLNNINLRRNGHRMDVDSIYLVSNYTDTGRTLTLESNDVSASVSGNYLLSALGYSGQRYLHAYLPNYIAAPKKDAPDQNITFQVATRMIDSLLYVITPSIRGFNNSTISGQLNTNTQQLSLKVNVPFGLVGNVALNNALAEGTGNYERLTLKVSTDKLRFSGNALDLGANAEVSVGNDSLSFAVATTSNYGYGTTNLTGSATARGDSIYASLQPSYFLLNENKWEIPAGNRIVVSDRYLNISDFVIQSVNNQRVTINTELQGDSLVHLVKLDSIDLNKVGDIVGLTDYHTFGNLNGTVEVSNLYSAPTFGTNLVVEGMKFDEDTIGRMIVSGRYLGNASQLTLDPKTGIYNKQGTLLLDGTFAFDSASVNGLQGHIKFDHAHMGWLSPFVRGYLSKMQGELNGEVKITGNARLPDVAGAIRLTGAALHVDYLGTDYRIDDSRITIDNSKIGFEKVSLTDRFGNKADVTGTVAHNHLKDFEFRLRMSAPKFEAMNLQDFQNPDFYGNVLANIQALTVTGPVDDIRMNLRVTSAGASHLYLPVSSSADISRRSYVTFKEYLPKLEQRLTRSRNRFALTISAIATPEIALTMVIDPTTGDEINAVGNGSITLEIGSGKDIGIHGIYNIEQGNYTFTFKQLFFKRNFTINSGSLINFGGSLAKTTLDVTGSYRILARLYDLLNEDERSYIANNALFSPSEISESRISQNVDVYLYMKGNLSKPDISFKLDLPEQRAVGTYAYTKLYKISQNDRNQSDRELFNQVVSLLLVGTFVPQEGLAGNSSRTVAINNASEFLSSTASSQITGVMNRVFRDPTLAIDLRYKNYNYQYADLGTIVRNEVRLAARKSIYKERFFLELGSSYDWGRATQESNSSRGNSAKNVTGDFRFQYLVTRDGRLRFNAFRTANYDAVLQENISRIGTGVSWRKNFDNWQEFIHRPAYFSDKQRLPAANNLNVGLGANGTN